jgi:CubicO group peptidase (beta-lactamase class C family)
MKNIDLFLLGIFLLLSTQTFSQVSDATALPSAGLSIDRLERLSLFVEQEITKGTLPGAVVMVSTKNGTILQEAYGYSSLEDKREMETDHIFFIQSMTKPIITVAFMMLYEEGHFLLTDPVEKYLPQFKDRKVATDLKAGTGSPTEDAKGPITIAQLLSHTAGLSHGLGNTELDRAYGRALYFQPHKSIEDRVNALVDLPLIGQPGEQWYYSAAPDLLALLIEKFSGLPVPEFLQSRLFDPLGMEDTGYNLNEEQQGRVARYHVINREGKLMNSPSQPTVEGNTIFGGSYALFSTAADYMKFCQMLLNGGRANGYQLLSPKTIELMTMNQVGDLYPGAGEGFCFGFGVITDLAAYKGLGSEGVFYWTGIYNTHFFIDPKEEIIAIFMAQMAPYSRYWTSKLRHFVYQAIID